MAGGGLNGAGFGASGVGVGGQGVAGATSLGASFGVPFGGVNPAAGAASSVNFSTTLLQQLINPQGEGVTQAQLDGLRAELPADLRAQWDSLLNQLAVQGGEGAEAFAPAAQNVGANAGQGEAGARGAQAQSLASLSPVAEEGILSLLQQAIDAQVNAPKTGNEDEQEPTLADRLLAQTAPQGEAKRPVSLMRTVDADALPTDDAQSLWLNGVAGAAEAEGANARQEMEAAQSIGLQRAQENGQQMAESRLASLPDAVARNITIVSEALQSREKLSAVLTPHAPILGQVPVGDVGPLSDQINNVRQYQMGQNAADGSAQVDVRGLDDAALTRGSFAQEAAQLGNAQLASTPQPITSGFESLTFINELGVEHMQRPAQSENISHFSAEFTRTPTFQSPADQVAMQIRQQAHLGMQQIQLQLEPADLGRVEVQLEIASDGKVNAMVQAENQDTLDLLQRDSKALQDALASAGLDTSESDLQFSLNQQQNHDGFDAPEHGSQMASDLHNDEQELATPEAVIANYQVNLQQGLDIRV